MKRYILFAGTDQTPEELTWANFKGSFDTSKLAYAAAGEYFWKQVIDAHTGLPVG